MKRLLFILLFINQICFGQIINFGKYEFDISRLNSRNEYRLNKIDTIYSESKIVKIIYSNFYVFSSENHKYFLIVCDTTQGDEMPSKTKCFYYKGNNLLWTESRDNSISGACFFEINGSVIIKWDHPFAEENFHLFYDSAGYIFDTLDVHNHYSKLENDFLIKRWVKDSLYLSIINSNDKILCKKSFSNEYHNVYPFESGNGRFIILASNDTLYSYDNRFNLLWKKKFPRTNIEISYSGNYIMADLFEPIPKVNYLKHLYYEIYDNKTSLMINRIINFNLDNAIVIPEIGRFIKNSDLLNFYCYERSIKNRNANKTILIITDVKGQIIKSKNYDRNLDNPSSMLENNYLKIYNNNDLIDTIEMNYVP